MRAQKHALAEIRLEIEKHRGPFEAATPHGEKSPALEKVSRGLENALEVLYAAEETAGKGFRLYLTEIELLLRGLEAQTRWALEQEEGRGPLERVEPTLDGCKRYASTLGAQVRKIDRRRALEALHAGSRWALRSTVPALREIEEGAKKLEKATEARRRAREEELERGAPQ